METKWKTTQKTDTETKKRPRETETETKNVKRPNIN